MGDNIAQSIRPKAKLVRPHVAVITRVSGGMEDEERYRKHHLEVAVTKAQIFEGLEPGGTALVKRDDEHVFAYLRQQAKACGVEHLHTFGRHPEADVRLLRARRCTEGFEVALRLHGRPLSFTIGVNGGHLLHNTLVVLGALYAVGADLEQALASLPEVHESPGRGNRYQVQLEGGTALLLDYTRNASMPALHASLEVLADMTPGPGGRRIAVLRDMTELDGDPASYHRDVALAIERHGMDLVFAIGELMQQMYAAFPASKQGSYAERSEVLGALVKDMVQPGDVILAQGWRQLKLNRVIKALVGEKNYIPWG